MTVYTWVHQGIEHLLEVCLGEGDHLESWRYWASLEPRGRA